MWRRLFGRGRSEQSGERWSLDTPLLAWSEQDHWTIGDAVTGTFTCGGTGSGKTSGSGKSAAHAVLRAGFGGLVMAMKPDERAMWERYAAETGRSSDLRVFGPNTPWRFNFLDFEVNCGGAGAGLTENVLNLLGSALEVSDRGASNGGGREEGTYWRQASREMLRNDIDLLVLGTGNVSVPDLHRVMISAPTSLDMLRSEDWRAKSFCMRCLAAAAKREKSPRQAADFELVADYFMLQFPTLAEKTRSVVVSTCSSMISVLNRGMLRDLLCGETNLTPQAIEDGAIVVLDLPVKEYAEIGVIAQVIWKLAFQRSIERREIAKSPRPVFLWADEAQSFITSYDMLFQSTCRSSLVATFYLTQNISNVYAALGGQEKGRVEAASLLANFNTKVFHANADPTTNEWAASLIGRSLQMFASGSTSRGSDDIYGAAGLDMLSGSANTSSGFTEHYEFEVQPREFTRLRTGGRSNNFDVDAIVFQNGRVFKASGRSWLPVTFRQQH